jgi:hypothetical protein
LQIENFLLSLRLMVCIGFGGLNNEKTDCLERSSYRHEPI